MSQFGSVNFAITKISFLLNQKKCQKLMM